MRTKTAFKKLPSPGPVFARTFCVPWKEAVWIFLASAAFAVVFNAFYVDGIELKFEPKKSSPPALNQNPADYPGLKPRPRKPFAPKTQTPAQAPVPADSIPRLSLQGAYSRYLKKSSVFLDARKSEEYQEGHIPGALNFFGNELDQYAPLVIPQLTDKDQEIITYCHGGDCDLSLQVAKTLREQGYTQVKIFQDGWPAWTKAGYPTKTGEKP
jgi:rhodanese-related sulfurtransferase